MLTHLLPRLPVLAALVLATSSYADQLILTPIAPLDVSALPMLSVGDLAFETGANRLWVCDGSTNGLVYELNPTTGVLVTSIPTSAIPGFNLGADALAIQPLGATHEVAVCSSFGESEGGTLTQPGALLSDWNTSHGATGAAFDAAGNLWLVVGTTVGGGSTLLRVNTSTGAVLATVPILGTTSRMIDLAFDPHTGACYVLAEETGVLIEVNTSTGAQLSSTDLSSFLPAPRAIAGGIAFHQHGEILFVAGAGLGSHTVLRFRVEFASIACDGSGVFLPCPCGNNGGPGSGCGSSVSAQGAALTTAGIPEVDFDSFVLRATNVPATTSVLFFQGTALFESTPQVLGDGLICVTGALIRLGTKAASGGLAIYPGPGDPALHVRGAIPASGATRYYQAWYRNAASFCTPATFNFTSAVEVFWAP